MYNLTNLIYIVSIAVQFQTNKKNYKALCEELVSFEKFFLQRLYNF